MKTKRPRDSKPAHAWLAENERAIVAYNGQVAKRGVFSDEWRLF